MPPKRGEGAAKLAGDELLRGLHAMLLLGGDGTISYTERTILRKMSTGQFMLSEAESPVQETDKNIVAIDIDDVENLVRRIRALEASSPSALIAVVEAQMKIAENHLAEAKNDAKEEGWDSETVEYAGRQEGKVLAFLAVLKLLRSPPTEAADK